MKNETSKVRGAKCEVSRREVGRVYDAVLDDQSAVALDNLAPASVASDRTSHLAPRRIRRLRVGRDGIFPW